MLYGFAGDESLLELVTTNKIKVDIAELNSLIGMLEVDCVSPRLRTDNDSQKEKTRSVIRSTKDFVPIITLQRSASSLKEDKTPIAKRVVPVKTHKIIVANKANAERNNTEESLDLMKKDKENYNKGVLRGPTSLNYEQMKKRIKENLIMEEVTGNEDIAKEEDDEDDISSHDGLEEIPFPKAAASPEKYLPLANPNMKMPLVNLKPNVPPTGKKVNIVFIGDNARKPVKFLRNEAVKVDLDASVPCVRKCNTECIEFSDARELSVLGNAEFLRYHASQHRILNSYKKTNEELLIAIMSHYQSDHHRRHFVIPTLDEAKSLALDAITAPKKYRIAVRYGP